jgi:protein ImuA
MNQTPETANKATNQAIRGDVVSLLQRQLQRLDGTQPVSTEEVIGSGCDSLDGLLPMKGVRRGKLVEWLSAVGGGGVATLSLAWAQRIQAAGGSLVVLDRAQHFYPPAAAALGIDLERLIVVRPSCQENEQWAWQQVLQCQSVAVAWGWVDQLDSRTFRRWQLAAESSGAIGFLLRPASVRGSRVGRMFNFKLLLARQTKEMVWTWSWRAVAGQPLVGK